MARKPPAPETTPSRRMRGFEPAAQLLTQRIRAAGEARGFAVARLLTQWDQIAGPEMAAVTRPVKVHYGREGLGATLTLLVAPAHAPMVQMSLPRLIDRVNAAYGYAALDRRHRLCGGADAVFRPCAGQDSRSGPDRPRHQPCPADP
jgi:hypothetical protein